MITTALWTMLFGMLGIFFVMAVIILSTNLLKKLTGNKKKEKK